VVIPFFAFRIMVGCGLLMLGLAWLGSYLSYKHRLAYNRPLLWLTFFSFPLPFIAIITGWFTAEIVAWCRQEWLIGIRGSQHSEDDPRLAADFSGEPAGNDRNEGQRKAEERQPKAAGDYMPGGACNSDSCRSQASPSIKRPHPTMIRKAKERNDHRRPVLRRDAVESRFGGR